jgi:hypothetical protein
LGGRIPPPPPPLPSALPFLPSGVEAQARGLRLAYISGLLARPARLGRR